MGHIPEKEFNGFVWTVWIAPFLMFGGSAFVMGLLTGLFIGWKFL